jgi:hypothetical protein
MATLPERPPLAKPLSFDEVARLEEFRGMNRGQVRRHLLRLDGELCGRLLCKMPGSNGKTYYSVTLANLRALIPSLFPGEKKEARPDSELEEKVRNLEDAVERQAHKLGAVTRRLEVLEGMLVP